MLIAFYLLYIPSKLHTRNIFFILPITLLGHALDRLVSVSSIHYCTSTSDLSTSSSSRGLTTYVGISHLEGGFTLRCLQRLSRPGLATLLCSWRNNRSTSGQSAAFKYLYESKVYINVIIQARKLIIPFLNRILVPWNRHKILYDCS